MDGVTVRAVRLLNFSPFDIQVSQISLRLPAKRIVGFLVQYDLFEKSFGTGVVFLRQCDFSAGEQVWYVKRTIQPAAAHGGNALVIFFRFGEIMSAQFALREVM